MKRMIRAATTLEVNEILANKPWSASEEKRTKEFSHWLFSKLDTGDWGEFYEDEPIDELEHYQVHRSRGPKKDTTVTITKQRLTYAQNWDEEDRRVKQGKAVAGSTYYVVDDDGDVVDENLVGYKTLDDARHAAMIYIKDEEEKWS